MAEMDGTEVGYSLKRKEKEERNDGQRDNEKWEWGKKGMWRGIEKIVSL